MMNERLKALCEQAFSEAWESRKGPDGLVRTDGNPYIFYEMFAQLLIKECAQSANDWYQHHDQLHWDPATHILAHFGVEE